MRVAAPTPMKPLMKIADVPASLKRPAMAPPMVWAWHTDDVQPPPIQLRPHRPQLAGSLLRLTQPLLHAVRPD